MNAILAATDFSTRSDRALRRAAILARALGMSLTLTHVVDDDRPPALVEAEAQAAARLLDGAAERFAAEGVEAGDPRIMRGDPFDGILQLAAETDPALIVIGAHRRSVLKDMFVGTTAERLIRKSRWPVLMVNAAPDGPYRRVLAATDLSAASQDALDGLVALGLAAAAPVSIVHVFDAPAVALMARTTTTREDIERHIDQERARAGAALADFLAGLPLVPARKLLRHADPSPAIAIRTAAEDLGADLIVVGRTGRSGMSRALLGSVTQYLLQADRIDVLVMPCVERQDMTANPTIIPAGDRP